MDHEENDLDFIKHLSIDVYEIDEAINGDRNNTVKYQIVYARGFLSRTPRLDNYYTVEIFKKHEGKTGKMFVGNMTGDIPSLQKSKIILLRELNK